MMTTLIAAALAAAAPAAAPAQTPEAHAQHEQHPAGQHDSAQHKGMECCKHMKGETMDCCKEMAAADKAKCCADRAATHAEHHSN